MGIKLDILEVGTVVRNADNSVTIEAHDRVRGDIVINVGESNATWLLAALTDAFKGQ